MFTVLVAIALFTFAQLAGLGVVLVLLKGAHQAPLPPPEEPGPGDGKPPPSGYLPQWPTAPWPARSLRPAQEPAPVRARV